MSNKSEDRVQYSLLTYGDSFEHANGDSFEQLIKATTNLSERADFQHAGNLTENRRVFLGKQRVSLKSEATAYLRAASVSNDTYSYRICCDVWNEKTYKITKRKQNHPKPRFRVQIGGCTT